MDATRIGIIACRVGAAVLTVKAISGLGNFIPAFFDGFSNIGAATLGLIIVTVIPGLSAILLWIYAEKICRVSSRSNGVTEQDPLTNDGLVQIGTALLGLYLLVTGIIAAATTEVTYFAQILNDASQANTNWTSRVLGWRIGYLLEILFGAVLFFGKERVFELLVRVRRAGTGAP